MTKENVEVGCRALKMAHVDVDLNKATRFLNDKPQVVSRERQA
jgi:hypothetical protein